ncbi:MAG: pentapeptide repeat-containing protein [Sulfitobacter sp.]
MTDQDHIERINALTRNARNTWFALLGVLVFVGITLMGVEHIDFYGVNRATKLPLVDVEVPTRSFFFAAPVLTAAIFGYFHLYLIRLWDALGAAPTRINGVRLGDAVAPWLVTDAALNLRAWLRDETCTTRRTMEGPAMALNLVLAWGFGLCILWWLWISSMPARDIWITGVAGCAMLVSTFTGAASLAMLHLRMREKFNGKPVAIWSSIHAMASLVMLVPFVAAFSHMRTMGDAENLAALDLSDQNLVEKPPGWLPYGIARKDFLAVWCEREGAKCKEMTEAQQRDFAREWTIRRNSALADLTRPDWHKADTKPNLRKSDLPRTQLSGLNLSWAQLEETNLSSAQMEGVNLSNAYMQRANLSNAQMEGADLSNAQMEGADLSNAQMERADFSEAHMEGADLSNAQIEGANFRRARLAGTNFSNARMERAIFRGAQMRGADLGGAQMERADFRGTQLEKVNLWDAQMEGANLGGAQLKGAFFRGAQMEGVYLFNALLLGADLSGSLMTGTPLETSNLYFTNFSAALNNGGAIRFINLRVAVYDDRTDFRNTYMDGSVRLPDGFAEQMGGLCQRIDEVLEDKEFYGRWRGWVEKGSQVWTGKLFGISPPGWEDVTPIPPPEGCEWKTGPMPDATSPD